MCRYHGMAVKRCLTLSVNLWFEVRRLTTLDIECEYKAGFLTGVYRLWENVMLR